MVNEKGWDEDRTACDSHTKNLYQELVRSCRETDQRKKCTCWKWPRWPLDRNCYCEIWWNGATTWRGNILKSILEYTEEGVATEKSVCLYLQHMAGSSAYEILQESGAIKLPSRRTLRDYTYYTKTKSGFGDDVDQQLMEAAHIHICPEIYNSSYGCKRRHCVWQVLKYANFAKVKLCLGCPY